MFILMWLKQCHKLSPSHHHLYIYIYTGGINHSQSWMVYDIILPTLLDLAAAQTFQLSIFFSDPAHDFLQRSLAWV